MSDAYLLPAVEQILAERLKIPVEMVSDPEGGPGAEITGRLLLGGTPRHGLRPVAELPSEERWEFRVEARARWSDAELDSAAARAGRSSTAPLLVLARSFEREALARLRAADVSHADLKGNVFLRAEGLYLWLPADRPVQWKAAPRKLLNPFSKRSSLVVRALMENAGSEWGVRELAAELGISAGHVSEVLRTLVERGYAVSSGGKWKLGDAVAVLREWARRYDWRENAMCSYVVPYEPDETIQQLATKLDARRIRFALTLLSGADQVAPHVQHGQTHVYVEPGQMEAAAKLVHEQLYAEPVESGGSLHLLDPYYGRAAFYGVREIEGIPTVSNVQLFLDLLRFPLRGPEAARAVALGPLAAQLAMGAREANSLATLAE